MMTDAAAYVGCGIIAAIAVAMLVGGAIVALIVWIF